MSFVADVVTLDTGETHDKLGHLVGQKVKGLVTDSERGIGVSFEDGTTLFVSEVERE